MVSILIDFPSSPTSFKIDRYYCYQLQTIISKESLNLFKVDSNQLQCNREGLTGTREELKSMIYVSQCHSSPHSMTKRKVKRQLK